MPLVSTPVEDVRRTPWRAAVFGALAIVISIFVIAFVGYCTRDGAGGVPEHLRAPKRDAGPPPVVDAGMPDPDAGHPEDEIPTVALDVDAGPASVPEPALPPARVRDALLPLLEDCLKAALRFDPSIGGRARVSAEISALGNRVKLIDAFSPVLGRCIEDNGKALQLEGAPSDAARFDLVVRFDGLRSTVTIDEIAVSD